MIHLAISNIDSPQEVELFIQYIYMLEEADTVRGDFNGLQSIESLLKALKATTKDTNIYSKMYIAIEESLKEFEENDNIEWLTWLLNLGTKLRRLK